MDDQELDGLYARLRDAEDARKAALGVIQRQNKEIATLSFQLAEVDKNYIELARQSEALARVRDVAVGDMEMPDYVERDKLRAALEA